MREYLEQLLFVLAVGAAVASAAKRVGVPYNVALVVVGLLLVLMNVLPETPMDPAVVLLVFLPMLVFQGALSADDVGMRAATRPILALAGPAVAVSLLTTAAVAAWGLGLPFPIALVLGAILAITDTVSVLLAFRSVRVPHRLAAMMEGESLFNDGTALVLVGVAATVALGGFAGPRGDCPHAPRGLRRRRGAGRRLRRGRHAGAPPRRPTISAPCSSRSWRSSRHRCWPKKWADRR